MRFPSAKTERPKRRGLTLLAGLAWPAVAALWLADALGAGLPRPVDAAAAGAALALSAAALAGPVRRLWRGGPPGRTLLALLAVVAVTYFTGLAHELTTRYFGDEGIYLAQAQRINQEGELLRPWFIYPHLLFYLDAFALWLASTLQPLTGWLAALLYGVDHPAALDPLVTRGVTALLGAATVVPVFVAARRLAGPVAAGLAGGLVALGSLFIEVAHLNISDVVGGFFAAMTFMQCALLLEGESRRGYVLAGLWAGLAAGGKYPAGVAAVAVFGVWLGWRIRERNLRPGLLWAAAVSIAAFLATTPSFLAYPGAATQGQGADLLFGVRQYARAGWFGVERASNAGYYLGLLRHSFGLPALLLGLTGVAGLDARTRRGLLWLAPFPVCYLGLIVAMDMAVPRNLLPVVPALAVAVGAGAAGWIPLARRLRIPVPSRPAAAAGLAVLCLALPAWRATVTVTKLARPTTRELAAAWIPENLPPGSALVQEIYTPHVFPEHLYPSARPRYVIRFPPEQLRDPRFDFVFLASEAYGRFFRTDELDPGYVEPGVERYREIFETFEPVAEWRPGLFRGGPTLRLYELDPERLPWTTELARGADELRTAHPTMRPAGEGPVVFSATGQWALAKGYLEPGTYRVRVDARAPRTAGGVRVVTRTGAEVALEVFFDRLEARVSLPERDKYFVYVRLPEGSELRSVRMERITETRAGGRPRPASR
ncbi:MAG: ArnT family glycosyltransferase [Thermoanaerobaculia bacterium]